MHLVPRRKKLPPVCLPLAGFLICALAASAAAPVLVGTHAEAYQDLVTDGTRLWACVYRTNETTPGTFTQLVDGGDETPGATQDFPPGVLRMEASPEGVLYAAALGDETWTNPSIHLWRKAGEAAWVHLAQLRGTHSDIAVSAADIVFANGAVVVGFRVSWSFFGSGTTIVGGSPPIPSPAIYDPATGAVVFGPAEITITGVHGEGWIYGVKYDGDLVATRRNFRSHDGITWEPLGIASSPLNGSGSPFISLDDPGLVCVSGDTLFFNGPPLSLLSPHAVAANGVMMRYPVPLVENGYLPFSLFGDPSTFAVARGGESFLGFSPRYPAGGGQNGHLVVHSDDFLQTFRFHEFFDAGHVDVVGVPGAFYFLRATISGSSFYRLDLPPVRLAVGTRPALMLGTRPATASEPLLLELSIAPQAETFFQLETSTDLETWVPLGLPHASTRALTILPPAANGGRFFR